MAEEGPSFVLGDPTSPIAICTLSSRALLREAAISDLTRNVAILGALETENIGIERMLTTLLERPRIRWLIVCGNERRGPYQAQALFALFQNGVDERGAILGAPSRRAHLRMLTAEHLNAVRRQVRLHDLVGVENLDTIRAAVAACRADDPGPFEERVELPTPEPIVVPTRPFKLRERDPAGFLTVHADRSGGRLLVHHYSYEGELMHSLVGTDAESICGSLTEWGLVTRLDHAAYIGRELLKAELALRHGWIYRQDDALEIQPIGQTLETTSSEDDPGE